MKKQEPAQQLPPCMEMLDERLPEGLVRPDRLLRINDDLYVLLRAGPITARDFTITVSPYEPEPR